MPAATTKKCAGNTAINGTLQQGSIRVDQRRHFPENISVATRTNQERSQPLPDLFETEVRFPRASRFPLHSALFNGPLPPVSPILPPSPLSPTLLILAIGVVHDGLIDPHHDLGILEVLFKDHESEGT
ncbi:hypothetical protein RSAG8_09687, partial [Rhizoctonia solani AG-8 WAC10335]